MRPALRAAALDPEKHLEELLALHNATDAPHVDGGTLTEDLFRGNHLQPGRGGEMRVFGAWDAAERLVGFTVLEAHPERGYGFRLVAGEDAHARGAAVDAALKAAREAGAPRLRAWARTADARMLLQAYGLRVTSLVTEMARPLTADVPAPGPRVETESLHEDALGEAVGLLNAAYNHKWPGHDPWTARDLARWAAPREGRVLGAREPGKARLVAVCGLRPRAAVPSAWEIGRFAVHPDAQGRGVGRSLLRAALKILAEEREAGLARLSVFEGNPEALHLYRSEGFQITGTSWVLVADPQW